MELGVSGLASGFDWKSLIDQLSDVERLPQKRLRLEQQGLEDRNAAYGDLVEALQSLQDKVQTLQDADLFGSRAVSVGDAAVAKASVTTGAVQGSFTFHFQQLATAARQQGTAGVGRALSETEDVSALTLSSAGFSTAVTAGTFTVNGRRVTLATSDTLQEVFDKISTATGGSVTGGYDAATDRITLASASPIVLGSATDTTNFLQVARLNNNGTGTVTSVGDLGGVRLSATLANGNFATAVSGNASGNGTFRINGVDIAYSLTDTTADVLQRINDSAAGVLATYDTVNDRFVLTNEVTGDVGVSLADVTGNFLAATGLSSGTLQRGKDLQYTVNGGGVLTSHSNTVSETSSGLTGLSVTALQEGETTTVTVSSDTDQIKTAINDFVDQFNKVQTLIETKTAVSTDSAGKVTANVLSNESTVDEVARKLRSLAITSVGGLASTLDRLQKLGFDTNSEDNQLSLEDEEALDTALRDQLSDVAKLFTDSTHGIATGLDAYLKKMVGEDGTLLAKQDTLTQQASAIDTQVAELERIVQANRERMTQTFIAMEDAQSKINEQLAFLQKQFGSN